MSLSGEFPSPLIVITLCPWGGDSVHKEAGLRTWPTNDKMEAQRRRSKKSERLDRSPYPIASEFEKYHGGASINKWNVLTSNSPPSKS